MKHITLKTLSLFTALGLMSSIAHADKQQQHEEENEAAIVQSLKLNGREHAIAVLPNGAALYTFDHDIGANQPTCNSACAEKWPPVIVDSEDIEGDARLGTIKRVSGLDQLTINGKPVYMFYEDRSSGDTYGDGLGNVWHLVDL